jgi:hypothetical protein
MISLPETSTLNFPLRHHPHSRPLCLQHDIEARQSLLVLFGSMTPSAVDKRDEEQAVAVADRTENSASWPHGWSGASPIAREAILHRVLLVRPLASF